MTSVAALSLRPTRAKQLAGAASRSPRQSMTPRVAHLVAEEDVLGDRQQRHQRQLLVDDDDAERSLSAMPRKARSSPSKTDLALVGAVRIDAAQHLHQRRFAGAVLADQRVDLAAPHRRLTLSSAFTPGNVLVMPRISRMGSPSAPSLPAGGGPAGARPARRPGSLLDLVLGVVAAADQELSQLVLSTATGFSR